MTSFFEHHHQQVTPVGCMYASAYVVTGDSTLLEYLKDISPGRYYARLIERGLLSFPLYVCEPPLPYTPVAFWENLRQKFTRDNSIGATHAPLMVSIPGTSDRWMHQVAVAIPVLAGENTVHVSDSNYPKPLSSDWETFLNSAYACAQRVEMLGPLDVDAYPEQIHASGGPYEENA